MDRHAASFLRAPIHPIAAIRVTGATPVLTSYTRVTAGAFTPVTASVTARAAHALARANWPRSPSAPAVLSWGGHKPRSGSKYGGRHHVLAIAAYLDHRVFARGGSFNIRTQLAGIRNRAASEFSEYDRRTMNVEVRPRKESLRERHWCAALIHGERQKGNR
jgi:hypothetical protein